MFDIYSISITTDGNTVTWLCYKISPCFWKTHITAALNHRSGVGWAGCVDENIPETYPGVNNIIF